MKEKEKEKGVERATFRCGIFRCRKRNGFRWGMLGFVVRKRGE